MCSFAPCDTFQQTAGGLRDKDNSRRIKFSAVRPQPVSIHTVLKKLGGWSCNADGDECLPRNDSDGGHLLADGDSTGEIATTSTAYILTCCNTSALITMRRVALDIGSSEPCASIVNLLLKNAAMDDSMSQRILHSFELAHNSPRIILLC